VRGVGYRFEALAYDLAPTEPLAEE
jgi:hypothetical protein